MRSDVRALPIRVRRRKSVYVIAPLIAIGIAVPLAITSDSGTSQISTTISPPSGEPSGWQVSYPIVVPRGYQDISDLLPTADGTNIWFIAADSSQETIFDWSTSSQSMTSYRITGPPGLGIGQFAPILQDGEGNIWIGLNSRMLELDPRSGQEQTFQLPDVSTAASGNGLPTYPGGGADNPITSIAMMPRGNIAIARSFASELQVLSTTSDAISTVSLPRGTVLPGVAGTIIGDPNVSQLVAVLYSRPSEYQLFTYTDPNWVAESSPCPPYSLSSANGVVTLSGLTCIATSSTGPGHLSEVVGGSVNPQLPAIALSKSTVLVAPQVGSLDAYVNGMSSIQLDLGTWTGYSNNDDIVPTKAQVGTETVPVTTLIAESAQPHSAWFVPSQGPPEIGEITYSDG